MRRGERGAAALEWALLAPVLVLVLCVMTAGWRLQSARAGVQQAAQSGARAASLQIGAVPASAAATASTRAALETSSCHEPVIHVDTSAFSVPAGNAATVVVTVSCRVALADLLVPGLPGSVLVDASASTPLDRYRRR